MTEETKQPAQLKPSERKTMNNKFDESNQNLAESVTRRAALKKFGVGLAGMVLAGFEFANKAEANATQITKQ
jgi:hypothetical protein